MNAIELQIWKNHELQQEELMREKIELESDAYKARKNFVTLLSDALGDFFPDLVSGQIHVAPGTYRNWRVNIRFRSAGGYIEMANNSVLRVLLGDQEFYGLTSNLLEKFADWLAVNSE